MEEKIWTVKELNNEIGNMIDDTSFPMWLTGEVTKIYKYETAVYVTLRDFNSTSTNTISVVQWGSENKENWNTIPINSKVELFGRVKSQKARGAYQFLVWQVRLEGKGDIHEQLEKLKQKLREEGLFDDDKKLSIPRFPKRIGVITSTEGAVIRDFLKIIESKFPKVNIIICPSLVQGVKSEGDILDSITLMECLDEKLDVLVIMRGGGSSEDLWTFNSEKIARKIASCNIPIISAIGHEIDYTICDFVADKRAPTPTAAGEMIVCSEKELINDIESASKIIKQSAVITIDSGYNQLNLLVNKLEDIKYSILDNRHIIDELIDKIEYNIRKCGFNKYIENINNLFIKMNDNFKEILSHNKETLSVLIEKLDTLEFCNVLNRGYSILTDSNNNIIYSVKNIDLNDSVKAKLCDGSLKLICAEKFFK